MNIRTYIHTQYAWTLPPIVLAAVLATVSFAATNDQNPCTEATSQKGFFTGRVTDSNAKPINDATVYWGQNHVYTRYHESTKTDANGFYRLEATKQRPSTSHLTVFAEGYAPFWQEDVIPGTCEDPNEVNFTLAAGHQLTVTVVDENDQPIPAVHVEPSFYGYCDQLPGYEILRTDANGVALLNDLPEPNVRILLARDWFKNKYFIANVDTDITVTMAPAAVIRGLVIDDQNGLPVKNFRITTIPGQSQTKCFSDPNGYFQIDNIPWPRDFELIITAENYPALYVQQAQSSRPDKAETKVYFLPKPRLVNAILIDEATGKPISHATITSALIRQPESSIERSSMMDAKELTTDEQGRFTLCDEDGSQSQDYHFGDDPHYRMRTLFINLDGYESIIIHPTERKKYLTESGSLRIVLARGASISGIYAINGRPKKDVGLFLSGANHRHFGWIKTDESGSFMWKNLPQGYYHILGPFFKYQLKLDKAEQRIVDFAEEMGNCTFSGYAAKDNQPLSNATVNIYPTFESPLREFWSRTDEHGYFHFENLRAGSYHAYPGSAYAGGGNDCGPQLVTVTENTEQDLNFSRRR